MNKKRIYIIISIIILILTISILFIFFSNEKNYNENNKNVYNSKSSNAESNINSLKKNNNKEIDKIKENTGMAADNNLYQVDTEYDGRKVLNIKTDIQYKVAFTGIIKQDTPELNEVDNFFNDNYPSKKGIWVEKQSKNKVLELINSNTKSKYKINEEGYLLIENDEEQNENDRNLKKLINANKTIILTINSIYYEIDTLTGEIVKYPFEKLDNYQTYDMIESDDNLIIIITSNSNNKLTNAKIIEEVLQIEI